MFTSPSPAPTTSNKQSALKRTREEQEEMNSTDKALTQTRVSRRKKEQEEEVEDPDGMKQDAVEEKDKLESEEDAIPGPSKSANTKPKASPRKSATKKDITYVVSSLVPFSTMSG